MKISLKTQAILALVIVAVGVSLLNLVVRLMDEGFEPFTQVYLRIACGFLLALPLFWTSLRWRAIGTTPLRDWPLLFLMGSVGYSVPVYLITLGALQAKLVNVSVLSATIPIFVYMYSLLFLKIKMQAIVFPLIIISLWGIDIIATKSFFLSFTAFGLGELYVVLSAATFAWFSVGRKLLTSHLNDREVTLLVMLIAACCSFAFAFMEREIFVWHHLTNPHVLLGLIIGAILNIMTILLQIFAFKWIDTVVGNQILLIGILFSLLLGFLLYHEIISYQEFFGGVIVVSSIYVTNKVVTH